MGRRSHWQHYIDAALGRMPVPPGPVAPARNVADPRHAVRQHRGTRILDRLRSRLPSRLPKRVRNRLPSFALPQRAPETREGILRRTDVRLVPSAALVWAAAAAGYYLDPGTLAALRLLLVAASALLLFRSTSGAGARPAGAGTRAPGGQGRRSFLATMATALLLAAAASGHTAVDSSRRHEGAVAEVAAAQSAVAVEVEITGAPRQLRKPGSSGLADRWAVPATLTEMNVDSRRVQTRAKLLVMGGADWEQAAPGQRIRTTGKLTPSAPGQAEAAVLSASSAPTTIGAPGPWQRGPGELRGRFAAAAGHFEGDARGLLPGMVTGDTSSLDSGLDEAMKSVGMTHLTAVSGANCSLILGALLLAARSLRLTRALAAVLGIVGLGLFVLMVGPDPSVLRAAVMGAIGLVALSGGRTGRCLSLLCVAVIGLVLAQPELSASFGFLLSVVATLGIVVTGRPIMAWFPAGVPRWVAAGVAVPLSAQAVCAPLIVLLQPQFSSYALPANMAAAVLVAPVTLLGTAAVPLVPLAPVLAAAPLGIAAAFASGVGGIARFFAGLPGAVLPWPEGAYGASTMALFTAVCLAACWLVFHPARTAGLALAAHRHTVALLSRMPRLPAGVRAPSGRPAALRAARGRSGAGLLHRAGRGTLRACNQTSGRKPQCLLPRLHAPGPRHRRPPPGVT
ncbi:ComEC/Rec2 family competence protein [Arthrobacter sp. PsM3]|uniref:ComEC/Rec2 family competence protein n=1 Tax=Arthrobacter sp. PsM3 TaxID=3030531 RepID=UPI00263B0919|nr:ComEC/Rec2 family competence protein [Arthrobacter sp. PsM3]MDN4646454.1 ComEC/Rec2 family competence protein [Arthrobacter sp. PsM3]